MVWLNAAWTRLCGYTREEMMDRSLKVLQGPATDQQAVQTLMHHVHEKKPCRVPALVNYDRTGRPFRHTLNVVPLSALCFIRNLAKNTGRHLMPVCGDQSSQSGWCRGGVGGYRWLG